jgi:group I intron endonuclease
LVDPETREVRYVGKSVDPENRFHAHLAPSHLKDRTHKNAWLRRVVGHGLRPVLLILEEVPAGEDENARERFWISFYRECGARLTNGTDGGDGTLGRIVSDETREKMARAQRGKKGPPQSEETRRKKSEANKGRSHSAETREKLRQGRLGKKHSEESKRKMSEVKRGRQRGPLSEERKRKISDARRRYFERLRQQNDESPPHDTML